ncbi:MAG: tetratricopeptide repeat protein [Nitrospirae bacterium]|nr:tetratricopeptide repeat protein [Nitrospirota bacterium]
MHKKIFSKQHLLILLLIAVLISPVLAFADADNIFKENSKAVVVVVTLNEKGESISQGSGFIVRPDGAVVTNYHVISNARDIKVKVGDKVLDVEGLIHTDKENDLVILKVKGEKLPIVKLGDISKVNIGEKVYVISSPEGLENTISDGLLSGVREITSDRKILQITAPISPGSSGGPVFNKDGEVIGIATFLIKEAQNLNFAMPVNLVKDKITSKKVVAVKESDIEDYKKSAVYWFVLGYYYNESSLHKEAIEAYKQAIRIMPDNAAAHYNLGLTYNNLKMHKEAIEAYKQAIRIKPDYAEAHFGLGRAYGKSEMNREAKEAFIQAIRSYPDYFDAHYMLGVTNASLGMYKEAIESYKQAIRIKPDFVKAHYLLGLSYRDLGMNKEAVEAFKQAIRIKPDYAEAHSGLGGAYGDLGMNKEAVEVYKQALRIKPDYAEAHYSLGLTYGILKMYKEAMEAFKQVIRIKPDYAEAHSGLGFTYLFLGDRGSALEEYKILKDLDPEQANELFNLIYK